MIEIKKDNTNPQQDNPLPCVFEKALFCQAAVCEAAQRGLVAEREVLICRQPLGRASCKQLFALLRSKSAFALKLKNPQRPLSHANLMKIQCGGLFGMKQLLAPQAHAADVLKLTHLAQQEYADLEHLPYGEIIQAIANWQIRRWRSA